MSAIPNTRHDESIEVDEAGNVSVVLMNGDPTSDVRAQEPPPSAGEVLRWSEEIVEGSGRVYWHILTADGAALTLWQADEPGGWAQCVDSRDKSRHRLAARCAALQAKVDAVEAGKRNTAAGAAVAIEAAYGEAWRDGRASGALEQRGGRPAPFAEQWQHSAAKRAADLYAADAVRESD